MAYRDPFGSIRHEYKGVYVATATPASTRVLAHATEFRALEEKLQKIHQADKPIAVQYLEPKRAICAYGVSVLS